MSGVNSDTSVVISGFAKDVDTVLTALEQAEGKKVNPKRLKVSHGFHSPCVEPMLDDLCAIIGSVNFAEKPTIPIICNLTGRVVEGGELSTPQYWRDHTRNAVRFSDAVHTLADLELCRVLYDSIGSDASLWQ